MITFNINQDNAKEIIELKNYENIDLESFSNLNKNNIYIKTKELKESF